VTAQLDVEEVRRALTTHAVLDFYGWEAKGTRNDLESSACPARADHSRRALVISVRTGRWQCFPCSSSGDLFDFIAGVERLAIPADFGAVLTKAAAIAGVGPSELTAGERAARKLEWTREQARRREAERVARAARDAAALVTASAYWRSLPATHARGIEYLGARGVARALELGDIRFDERHGGAPALALRTSGGQVRNVVVRRPPELGEPKTRGLYDCPTAGTLIGSIHSIEAVGTRDVTVVEGVVDAITATLAWPHDIVLGAHGACNLPAIAQLAAPATRRARRRMRIVPHADRVGFEAALEMIDHAHRAGLTLKDGSLEIVQLGAKDLNDAWQQGWRPAA
jgi:hypothetical protein